MKSSQISVLIKQYSFKAEKVIEKHVQNWDESESSTKLHSAPLGTQQYQTTTLRMKS